MFKSCFKIAFRKMIDAKVFTIINILGLALGICTCLVIYLIVNYEFSFDTFHPHAGRIYRVVGFYQGDDGDKHFESGVPVPAARAIRSELSGVEEIGNVYLYDSHVSVSEQNKQLAKFDNKVNGVGTSVIAEPQYFNIFKYTWLAGNEKTALNNPSAVVITESKAKKYFDYKYPEECIGKSLTYNDSLHLIVTGVVKDWSGNTDLGFTDFISFATVRSSFLRNDVRLDDWSQDYSRVWCFLRLGETSFVDKADRQLSTLAQNHMHLNQGSKISFFLQPLGDLHFDARFIFDPTRKANKLTLFSLIGVAFFILAIAVINFINLSTAQGMQRTKEIGIRKVLGSSREGLALQFFVEAFSFTLFSTLLSIALLFPVLSVFSSFLPEGIVFRFMDPGKWLFVLFLILITTLAAGSYPALVLSSFDPIRVLKGKAGKGKGAGGPMRKGLIIFQFSISIAFIISSMIIERQLWFVQSRDLGFKADAIVTIDGAGDPRRSKLLAEEIRTIAGVAGVALQSFAPMSDIHTGGITLERRGQTKIDVPVSIQIANEDFIPLYQLRLLAGGNLSAADSVKDLVLNASCIKELGFSDPSKAIGSLIYFGDKPYPIKGVVADYNENSLHESIHSIMIVNIPEAESSIAIKLPVVDGSLINVRPIMEKVEEKWKAARPGAIFSYSFVSDAIRRLYEKDRQTLFLVNTAMFITIFISCMGVFGLVMFTAERKKKEVGIRKVLGATVTNITFMLGWDLLILLPVSLAVASAVAWFLMTRWLQNFAYRIGIEWWTFPLAGLVTFVIAFSTMSLMGIRAARANPAETLRTE